MKQNGIQIEIFSVFVFYFGYDVASNLALKLQSMVGYLDSVLIGIAVKMLKNDRVVTYILFINNNNNNNNNNKRVRLHKSSAMAEHES